MEAFLAYLTLFLTSFAAATLLPAYSEILLGTLVSQNYPLFWLWFWATMGNTLGSVVNGLIESVHRRQWATSPAGATTDHID